VRRWQRGDEVLHHVVDPRTSRPASTCWRTVTVAAATCVDANVASTASLVMGERATEWLHHRSLPARLVRGDGTVERVAGWPQPSAVEPAGAGA
jgi:thiamine biosynthesis lipoprotein